MNRLTLRSALYTAAAFTVLSFASCKKDEVTSNPPGNTTARLASYSSGDEKLSFTYNADQSLKTVTVKSELFNGGAETAYNISYRSDKKIDALTAAGGDRIRLLWDNGILKGTETWIANQKVSVTDYEYQQGLLKLVTTKMVYGNILVPFTKFGFVYSNTGNIGRTNVWTYNFLSSQLEFSGHSEMEYDNNPSPFAGLKEVMAVFWQAASINNVTKITQFEPGGQPEEITEYTYTYNSKRLPVSAVVSSTFPGQTPVTSTAQFIYAQ